MPADESRITKQLGETVRRLRVTAGISQIALAAKTGLNHNFLGEIERGEKLASVITVVRLAAALGLKSSDLMARAKLYPVPVAGLPAAVARPRETEQEVWRRGTYAPSRSDAKLRRRTGRAPGRRTGCQRLH